MINFEKYISSCNSEKTNISPIEVYNGLDRTSETGPLRESQEWILEQWYKDRFDDKDLIVKMNTGEGKTLVGLLMLLTKLKHNNGRHIYLCPNLYLVNQVCRNADRFGIPYCKIEDNGEIPNDFLSGKKILIATIQKLFNGKSKFGIDNNSVGLDTVLIDDAHSCIEIVNKQYTLTIDKNDDKELYNAIITIFGDDLKMQGNATYSDIIEEKTSDVMLVPYWAFIDKNEQILNQIRKLLKSNDPKCLTWELIKNELKHCQCYVSSSMIEICPDYIDITKFGSFSNAKNRILMSASEQDQTFLIKTFQFSDEAIKSPLFNDVNKYTGEKMFLFPELLSDTFDRNTVANKFINCSNNKYGVVALVSSFDRAYYYSDIGAKIVDGNNMDDEILRLKEKTYEKMLVIVNRYDGIDLPDDSCRVLIFDSLPYTGSLFERYEDKCRKDSVIVNKRIAQKIEQGVGRGVRGEKDYCVILITGHDIIHFIFKNKDSLFSNQFQKQFEIGNRLMDILENNTQPPQFSCIMDLIKQVINRDVGWKKYYEKEMSTIECDRNLISLNIIKNENEFFKAMYREDFDNASRIINELIEMSKENEYEYAWYLQQSARCKYYVSKIEAMELQKEAYQKNTNLLRPTDKISFKRVMVNLNQIEAIKIVLSKYDSYQALNFHIDEVLKDLSFEIEADKFEEALKLIGNVLGFGSTRPDKLYGEGPDNLWAVSNNHYFLFECKSGVLQTRDFIKKIEVGQVHNHIAWFNNHYKDCDCDVYLIIPTKKLGKGAYLGSNTSIIVKDKLDELKTNIKSFIYEFSSCDFKSITNDIIEYALSKYNLNSSSFRGRYSENSIDFD